MGSKEMQRRYRQLRTANITAGSFMSEAVLWVNWVHLGDFDVIAHSSLLTLPVDRMEGLVVQYPIVQQTMRQHALRFSDALHKAADVSDRFSSSAALEFEHLRQEPEHDPAQEESGASTPPDA